MYVVDQAKEIIEKAIADFKNLFTMDVKGITKDHLQLAEQIMPIYVTLQEQLKKLTAIELMAEKDPTIKQAFEDITDCSYYLSRTSKTRRIIDVKFIISLQELLPDSSQTKVIDWLDLAYSLSNEYTTDRPIPTKKYKETLGNFYTSFHLINSLYGEKIATDIFNLVNAELLPNELMGAAQYLYNNGDISKITEMAQNGAFECGGCSEGDFNMNL